MPPDEARAVLAAIRHGLDEALHQLQRPWDTVTVISRSDSTLRGHFPLDVEILCGGIEGQGAGAGAGKRVTVVAPYFEAGGRLTVRAFVRWRRSEWACVRLQSHHCCCITHTPNTPPNHNYRSTTCTI